MMVTRGIALAEKMDIHVSNVTLNGPMKIAHLGQEAYATMVCPICHREDTSVLLSEIRSGNVTSLESAYCTRCEHRYFRKLPSCKLIIVFKFLLEKLRSIPPSFRSMEFSFHREREKISLPLRFHYVDHTPPIWIKES